MLLPWVLFCQFVSAGEFAILVKGIDGHPVENVKVEIGYDDYRNGSNRSFALFTDESGQCFFSGYPAYDFGIALSKAGFYETCEIVKATKSVDGHARLIEKLSVELVIKEIRNPVPMYVGYIRHKTFPELGKEIGYDLIEGDWISPYGQGKIGHLMIGMEYSYEKETENLDG